MADTKTTALTAATSWASGDLLYMVRDPAGTPVSRKITCDNFLQNLVCAADSSLLKSTTGYSLTGSNASSMIDLAGTWNTTGTPTLIKANVTDTASNASSLLMDLQAGGVTQFNARKDGVVSAANSYTTTSVAEAIRNNIGFRLGSGSTLGWCSAASAYGTVDLILLRDAANTLALRNSTNAQAFNIYNTYTSGSVYERGFMRWASDVLKIGTETVGGTVRNLRLFGGPTAPGVIQFQNSVVMVGPMLGLGVSQGDTSPSASAFFYTPSNGVLRITDSTQADFNRLQFGGTTSSFPALKRSSTVLQSRLADDSDFAPLQGQLRSHANATSETVTPTHTLRLFDAAGTEYRVPAIAV